MILVTLFDGVELAGFKNRANAFLLALSAISFLSPTVLSFSSSMRWLCEVGVFGVIECYSLSPGLAQRSPNNDNDNNNNCI